MENSGRIGATLKSGDKLALISSIKIRSDPSDNSFHGDWSRLSQNGLREADAKFHVRVQHSANVI